MFQLGNSCSKLSIIQVIRLIMNEILIISILLLGTIVAGQSHKRPQGTFIKSWWLFIEASCYQLFEWQLAETLKKGIFLYL